MPYPDYLKENMIVICPSSWVGDQIKEKYGVSYHDLHEEGDALNIGMGCSIFLIDAKGYIHHLPIRVSHNKIMICV